MNKITRSLLFLIPVFFLFFNACTTEDINIEETSTNKKYKVPTLQKAKAYFEERENIFTNDLKAANNDNIMSVDWQSSFPITYKESRELDILYSPVKYTTSARVKSFVASVEKENIIESEIITVAYDKTHRNDKGLTGIVFRHTIEGEPIAFYRFKEGYKIDFITNVTKSSEPDTKDISDCLGYLTVGEILEMIETVGIDNVICVEVGGDDGGGEDTDPWGDPWSEQDPLNGTSGEPSPQEPSFGGGNTFDNWWEEAEGNFAEILIQKEVDEEDTNNPFLFANCDSFEYYKPPQSPLTCAAVNNMTETFHTVRIKPDGSPRWIETEITYNRVYFTMPSWRRNGEAANLTAQAVTAANNATQIWYALNPNASGYTVSDKWMEFLRAGMLGIGGQFSKVPPFTMRNAANYRTTLLTSGNCD